MKPDSLMLELTRYCNMECPHCIRGDRQRRKMSKDTIIKTLESWRESFGDYINTLMFTGGEPVLSVDLMEFTLESCRMMGINVGNFWLATNGLIHTKRVQNSIREWLEYTDNGEINGIRISIDPYHDPININYWREFEEDLKNEGINVYFEFSGAPKDEKNLISGGRAEESGWGTRSITHEIMLYDKGEEFEYIEGVSYINYRGDLISTCDISFELQDEEDSDFNLGNVYQKNLESMYIEFFERHPELVN